MHVSACSDSTCRCVVRAPFWSDPWPHHGKALCRAPSAWEPWAGALCLASRALGAPNCLSIPQKFARRPVGFTFLSSCCL